MEIDSKCEHREILRLNGCLAIFRINRLGRNIFHNNIFNGESARIRRCVDRIFCLAHFLDQRQVKDFDILCLFCAKIFSQLIVQEFEFDFDAVVVVRLIFVELAGAISFFIFLFYKEANVIEEGVGFRVGSSLN